MPLNAKTGTLAWTVKTKAQVHATAAVANGLAYISGCDGILRAIRLSNGTEAYIVEIGSYTGASPALEGQIGLRRHFQQRSIRAEPQTRRNVWKYEHPERKFPFYSTAAVWREGIRRRTRQDAARSRREDRKGRMDIHDQGSHRFFARDRGRSGIFGSNDGNLYFVDAATGKQTYQFTAGAAVSSSPALSGDKIVISAQDGKIYCFGS